ncbi:hypothetical protein ACOSQ2_006862 [Xanthoceras sorbifolium]
MHEPAANTNINDDGVNDPQEDQVDDDGVEDRAEAHMEDPLEDRVDDDRVEDRAEAHVEDPAEDRVNDDRVEDRVEAHMEDSPENRVDDDGVKDPMKAPAEDRVDDDGDRVEYVANDQVMARKIVWWIVAWPLLFFPCPQGLPIEMPPQLPFFSRSVFSKLRKPNTLITSTQNLQGFKLSAAARLQNLDRERNNLDEENSSMGNFWLAPQYCLLGLMQGSAIDGLDECMIGELPKSLKNYASAMNGFVIDGIGNLIDARFVNILEALTTSLVIVVTYMSDALFSHFKILTYSVLSTIALVCDDVFLISK